MSDKKSFQVYLKAFLSINSHDLGPKFEVLLDAVRAYSLIDSVCFATEIYNSRFNRLEESSPQLES